MKVFGFRPTETCHTDNHNLIQHVASVTTFCSSFYRPMSYHDSWVLPQFISDLFQYLVVLFFSLQVCICTGEFLCHCDGVKGQKVRIPDDVTTVKPFSLVRIIMTDIRMYDTLLSSIFSVKMKLFENFFLYVFRTSFVLWNHFEAWSVRAQGKVKLGVWLVMIH